MEQPGLFSGVQSGTVTLGPSLTAAPQDSLGRKQLSSWLIPMVCVMILLKVLFLSISEGNHLPQIGRDLWAAEVQAAWSPSHLQSLGWKDLQGSLGS